MRVEFQRKQMEFPTPQFGYLRDSTGALVDVDELRRRIAADGYLFIRRLSDRDAVLAARRVVMEHLREQDALVEGTPLMEGAMPRDGRSVGMKRVAYRPESFYRRLYGEEPATFDHKWLRAVGNEKFTGSHVDVVYMGRGSERVNTVWIPFGDIPIAQGTLAVCEASHRLDSFARVRALPTVSASVATSAISRARSRWTSAGPETPPPATTRPRPSRWPMPASGGACSAVSWVQSNRTACFRSGGPLARPPGESRFRSDSR